MNTKSKIITALTIAILFLLLSVSLVVAATFSLSGRVIDQSGNPLAGSTVEILTPGTSTIVASTTTDNINGDYTISVNEGIYDVRVTPPAGSGFTTAIAIGRSITNDTLLDFVLVPEGVVSLSGRILDPLGNGLPGQIISVYLGGTRITRTTDEMGRYSFELTPGNYSLEIRGANPPTVNAPQEYMLSSYSTLAITQSMVMDIVLPLKRVRVHVQDMAGNPVANVRVEQDQNKVLYPTNLTLGPFTGSGYYFNRNGATNASGDVDLWCFPTNPIESFTLIVSPPQDSDFSVFNVEGVTVISDRTIIVVLQDAHDPPITKASFDPPANPSGTYSGPVTVTLTATAAEGFTVATTYYSIDSGTTQSYSIPFTVSGEGSHTIRFWSVDNLGVIESPNILTFQIQSNQPPVADAGGPYSVDWSAMLTLDASSSTDPENNITSYEWDLNNDGHYNDASGVTITTSFNQVGEHIIGLRVTDNGGLSSTDTATVTVLPWTLKGFYQPVDMNGVYNLVKGGSTVPLKFEVFAGSTELTDITYIKSIKYASIACDASAVFDEIETIATGGTSLRYAEGQFIYNWKTPKTAGCYRVTMTTIDGSSLAAYFKLK